MVIVCSAYWARFLESSTQVSSCRTSITGQAISENMAERCTRNMIYSWCSDNFVLEAAEGLGQVFMSAYAVFILHYLLASVIYNMVLAFEVWEARSQ